MFHLIPHNKFLNFSCNSHGKTIDIFHIIWNFIMSDLSHKSFFKAFNFPKTIIFPLFPLLLLFPFFPFIRKFLFPPKLLFQHNMRHDLLPIFLIFDAKDMHIQDLLKTQHELLDLLGVDILTASDYEVFYSPLDGDVAGRVHRSQVARVQPAGRVDCGGGRL
jgi:hypothetical protein